MKKLKLYFAQATNWIRWQICRYQAKQLLARIKQQFPGCEGARNVWPTTGAGDLSSGYLADGVTTVVWGTKDILANIGGVAMSGSLGVVTRMSQRPLVDNIKLPQGDGLTSSRIQIIDGAHWELTVRDDTRITKRPKIGNTILVFDGAGFIPGSQGAGGTPSSYIATIIDAHYEVAPKQAAEFSITAERLTLITETQVGV